MKKLFILLALFTMICSTMCGQAVRSGNNFTQQSVAKVDSTTSYTYTDSKKKVYPIYISRKGKPYIIKVSGKTGKPYRFYLKDVTL
jgi:hypothetical protein